ncbi:transposase [Luteolibacter ambystomatis]|uniref:Transposase n=2 Tax=Luteolibacter ambystomatis TaxID=2824561 RepID=A0A975J2F0_9BACT|nr:transposase [Luteolibacter ambystomatis]QUE52769.1 transposase [Luteolibacter ambystomatis]
MNEPQWTVLEPLLPDDNTGPIGRPRVGRRAILNGILWILRTGAQWADLPTRYGSYQTVHRQFQEWEQQGVMRTLLRALADDPRDRGKLDVSECFVDATFASAKKGRWNWQNPQGQRGSRSWQWSTAMVFLSPFARKASRWERKARNYQALVALACVIILLNALLR